MNQRIPGYFSQFGRLATSSLAVIALTGTILVNTAVPFADAIAQEAPVAPDRTPVEVPVFGDADVQKIAAVVNDRPITEYDVYQRLALIVTQAGFQLTADDLARMREQILRALIDENLKLEEALTFKVTPQQSDIDGELAQIAAQNNMTLEQIETSLAEQNIGIVTLERQIAAEIVWSDIVQGRFRASISITDEEVDAVYQRTVANASKPQYRVHEIFIRVDTPEQEADIRSGVAGLAQQIEQGANFQAVAQQISHSPSAAQGGDIGWVQDGQLQPELNMVLRNLKKGEISHPVRTISGYYLLRLVDRRMIGGVDPLKSVVSMKQLVFPLAPETPQDQIQGAGTYLMQASQAIKSCDDLAALREQMGSGHLSEEQSMPIGELAEIFQAAVIPLQTGESSAPILTNQGFHLITVCSREDIGLNLPDREAIENQLASQQLSMMARRYLRDLRNDAVVELR